MASVGPTPVKCHEPTAMALARSVMLVTWRVKQCAIEGYSIFTWDAILSAIQSNSPVSTSVRHLIINLTRAVIGGDIRPLLSSLAPLPLQRLSADFIPFFKELPHRHRPLSARSCRAAFPAAPGDAFLLQSCPMNQSMPDCARDMHVSGCAGSDGEWLTQLPSFPPRSSAGPTQMGAHAGLDYWTRAEDFIVKRRSGEIDPDRHPMPRRQRRSKLLPLAPSEILPSPQLALAPWGSPLSTAKESRMKSDSMPLILVLGAAAGYTFWDTADIHGNSAELIEYVKTATESFLKRLAVESITISTLVRRLMQLPLLGGKAAPRPPRGLDCDPPSRTRRSPHFSPASRVLALTLDIKDIGLLSAACGLGIQIIAYSPLGCQLFTGHSANFPDILKLVEGLKSIGKKYDAIGGQVALACVLAQGDDIIAISGTKKIKYMENIGAAKLKLSAEDLQAVRKVAAMADAAHGERNPAPLLAQILVDMSALASIFQGLASNSCQKNRMRLSCEVFEENPRPMCRKSLLFLTGKPVTLMVFNILREEEQ
ncbi:hypothetical protein B0H19DRAFT_1063526 [Mycena capillaripes]|nr:hypothetical protein B0H19DRAFT_1063526 [Mycena capillaripes]